MVAKSKTSFKIIQNEKKNYHRERRDAISIHLNKASFFNFLIKNSVVSAFSVVKFLVCFCWRN